MGPEVCFDNVNASIGGREILSDIRAVAPAGGATVLIGPNGAGKTTLLHCLLGEMSYTGHILFLENGREIRPSIGYVPQSLMVEPFLPLRVFNLPAPSALAWGIGRKEKPGQIPA